MTKFNERSSKIHSTYGGQEVSYNDIHSLLRKTEPNISPTRTNFTLHEMKQKNLIEATSPGKMKVK